MGSIDQAEEPWSASGGYPGSLSFQLRRSGFQEPCSADVRSPSDTRTRESMERVLSTLGWAMWGVSVQDRVDEKEIVQFEVALEG